MGQLISQLLSAHCSLLADFRLPGDRLDLDSSDRQRCGSGIEVFGTWAWPGKQCDAADMHASSSSGCNTTPNNLQPDRNLGTGQVSGPVCAESPVLSVSSVSSRWGAGSCIAYMTGPAVHKTINPYRMLQYIEIYNMLWSTCLCDLCIDSDS